MATPKQLLVLIASLIVIPLFIFLFNNYILDGENYVPNCYYCYNSHGSSSI